MINLAGQHKKVTGDDTRQGPGSSCNESMDVFADVGAEEADAWKNRHCTLATGISITGLNLHTVLIKNEVNQKRPRTIETLDNVTFGEGQLAVDADALRQSRF